MKTQLFILFNKMGDMNNVKTCILIKKMEPYVEL